MSDGIDHPQHYGQVPGIECIDVVEHFAFNRGNAIKYLWRAGAKGDLVEDLQKAIWYIQREIDTVARDSERLVLSWDACKSCGGGGWVGSRVSHEHPSCGHRCILCDPPPGFDRTYARSGTVSDGS